MKIPILSGVIDRRILISYRVDPNVLVKLLPDPFRPKIIGDAGIAGVCLIRLRSVRPRLVPSGLGISSENAAHRVAVEWDDDGTVREGVYIWRRDTNSWLNSLAGGRIFPGLHHHARFTVNESCDRFSVALDSDDGMARFAVRARRAETLPASSIFESVPEASAFFQNGSLGYSPTDDASRFGALELRCRNWQCEPLAVEESRSSFIDDPSRFPKGSIELDSALLMRGIPHQWHAAADMCCETPVESVPATTARRPFASRRQAVT